MPQGSGKELIVVANYLLFWSERKIRRKIEAGINQRSKLIKHTSWRNERLRKKIDAQIKHQGKKRSKLPLIFIGLLSLYFFNSYFSGERETDQPLTSLPNTIPNSSNLYVKKTLVEPIPEIKNSSHASEVALMQKKNNKEDHLSLLRINDQELESVENLYKKELTTLSQ